MSSLVTTRSVAAIAAAMLIVAACGNDAATTSEAVTATAQAGATAPTTEGAPVPNPPEGAVVEAGDSVSVQYTGTLDSGEVFDSNVGAATLDFVAGAGQMIAGFDAAVIGMAVGETRTVTIAPGDAYGERQDGLIQEVDRANVPEDVEVGQELADGSGRVVVVLEVRDDVVLIDLNHRLAGETLTFEIEIVAIN